MIHRAVLAIPRRAREVGLAAALFSVVTVCLFFPLVRDLNSAVIREPGDASSTARDYWAAAAQGKTPFTLSLDRLLYAPEGQPRSPAVQIANGAQPGFVMVVRHAFGYLGALNLYMLLGFPLTGVAMYILLRRLLLHPLAAVYGAAVFAFSWWQEEQILYGHTAFTHVWVYPLLLVELLWLTERPRPARGAVVGATLGAAFYLSSYLGLIGSALVAVFILVHLLSSSGTRRPSLTSYVTLWSVTYLTLVPALVAPSFQKTRELGLPRFSVEALYGSNLVDFVLPSIHHPVLGPLVEKLRPNQAGENVLFFGYTAICLAAVFLLRYRARFLHAEGAKGRRLMVRFCIALLPVGVFLSLPGAFTAFGTHIRLPNAAYLIGSQISWWRIYARFGILVGLGIAILAAFGMDCLVRRRTRWRTALVAGALAVTVLELIPGYPVRVYNIAHQTAATRWLAAHPGGIVALYPMADARYLTPAETIPEWKRYNGTAIYAQVFHRHPLYSPPLFPGGDTHTDILRIATMDLQDPLTARILRGAGVRYVVVDVDAYRALGQKLPGPENSLKALADFGGTRIYSVTGTKLSAAQYFLIKPFLTPSVTQEAGFGPPESYENAPASWMAQDAEILISNPNTDGVATTFKLTLRGFSNAVLRNIALVAESGRVVARGSVAAWDRDTVMAPISLRRGISRFRLHVTPGPTPLGGADPRVESVFVRRITVSPVYYNLAEQLAGKAR